MRRALVPIFFTALLLPRCGFAASSGNQSFQPAAATSTSSVVVPPGSSIVIPPGSKIEMALTRPVWAKTVKLGDVLYAVTVFPVTLGNQMAIPSGTYVEGAIEALTKPTRKLQRAVLRVQFDKLIFANGYTLSLSGFEDNPGVGPSSSTASPALTVVTVQVSAANDLLLDNGSQISLTLQTPLPLSATQVAEDLALSRAPNPSQFLPATLCRSIPGSPGTPGTPDTFIPGTPSTVIPGGPGMPDTVIPGTPPTRIPGTPSTPDTPPIICPAPPLVLSSLPAASPPPPIPSIAKN